MMETASGFFGVHPGLSSYPGLGPMPGFMNGGVVGSGISSSSSSSGTQDSGSAGRHNPFENWNSYGLSSDICGPVPGHTGPGCKSFSPYSSTLPGSTVATGTVGLPKSGYSSFASGSEPLLTGYHPQLPSAPFGHSFNARINSQLPYLTPDIYQTSQASVGVNNAAAAAAAAAAAVAGGMIFGSESIPMNPRIQHSSIHYTDISSQNPGWYQNLQLSKYHSMTDCSRISVSLSICLSVGLFACPSLSVNLVSSSIKIINLYLPMKKYLYQSVCLSVCV